MREKIEKKSCLIISVNAAVIYIYAANSPRFFTPASNKHYVISTGTSKKVLMNC